MLIALIVSGIALLILALTVVTLWGEKRDAEERSAELLYSLHHTQAFAREMLRRRPRYVTEEEVAEMAGVSVSYLRRMVTRGKFAAPQTLWEAGDARDAAIAYLRGIAAGGSGITAQRREEAEGLLLMRFGLDAEEEAVA